MGIARVLELGIPVVILSTEHNDVVLTRDRKLGVECAHGSADTATAIRDIAEHHAVDLADTAFVGNDVNDLHALKIVAMLIAAGDARLEVCTAAVVVTSCDGGRRRSSRSATRSWRRGTPDGSDLRPSIPNY